MYEGRKKKVTKENEVIGQAATLEHRMSVGLVRFSFGGIV